MTSPSGMQRSADPEEEPGALHVHPRRGGEDLSPSYAGARGGAARPASRSRLSDDETTSAEQAREERGSSAAGCAAAGSAPREPAATRRRRGRSRRCRRGRRWAPRSCGRASPRTTRSARSTASSGSGPVGPLKNACWSSPQRPSNAIHGKAVARRGRVARDRLHAGRSSRAGRGCRRSRRPPPPSCRGRAPPVNLFACEPAAGIDDRMRSVDELELVVVPSRRCSAPSCEL